MSKDLIPEANPGPLRQPAGGGCYGHFGGDDPDLTWERTDRTEALAKALGKQ